MTPSQLQRSELLKVRNARRLAWEDLAGRFTNLGLSAQGISDEMHERVVDALRSLDPMPRLVRNDDWLDQARRLAVDEFSVLIGDPWEVHAHPIARVAGPALAGKLADLASLFPIGFFLTDATAARFFVVDFDEDPGSGEAVAESALFGM